MRGSYQFKGVELNDGTNFLFDARSTTLDDPNSVEATYATRKSNTPVLLNTAKKEVTIVLAINLVAKTPEQLDARIQTLRALFVADGKEYPFYRRLPHEIYHRFINVGVRSLQVNRLERKALVTVQAADATWLSTTEHEYSYGAFTSDNDDTIVVVNAGNLPTEPIIEITPTSVGTTGPIPLYYREVEVFTAGSPRVAGWPIKVVDSWDVADALNDEKMRSDMSDINVRFPDGSLIDHYWLPVPSQTNKLALWIKPTRWPSGSVVLGLHPAARPPSQPQLKATDPIGLGWVAECIISAETPFTPPSNGVVRINDEYISYTNGYVDPSNPQRFQFQPTARGVYGTTAQDHYLYDPILFPVTVRVSYGYASSYSNVRHGQRTGSQWPEIDYITSTNGEWHYNDTTRVRYDYSGVPSTGLNWTNTPHPNPRTRELMVVNNVNEPTYGSQLSLVSTYPYGSRINEVQRLVLPNPGVGAQRQMGWMALNLVLTPGPDANQHSFNVTIKRVRSGFGTSSELATVVWDYTFTSNIQQTVNTGYIALDPVTYPATHYVLEINNAPPNTSGTRLLRIASFSLGWDGWIYGGKTFVPQYRPMGAEGGLAAGEFPVKLSVVNQQDAENQTPFTITARMALGETGVIDCAEHTVTGALQLSEVDYTRATWLRLMPGNNSLLWTTEDGSGIVTVKVRWRDRW